MTEKSIHCPYCGAGETNHVHVDTFIEMGEYNGKSYESEGGVESFRCRNCKGEFWVNGPGIPSPTE